MTDRERIVQLEYRLLIEGMALTSALTYMAALRPDKAVKVLIESRARMRADAAPVQDSKRAA